MSSADGAGVERAPHPTRWDTVLIAEGIEILVAALGRDGLGEDQAQAAIAALHADRTDAAKWRAELEARFDVDGFLHVLALNTAATGASVTDITLGTYPEAGKHSFAADVGQVVVIDAWATWCAPCVRSLPLLQKLRRDYSQRGVRVYAVSVDEDRAQIPTFLASARAGAINGAIIPVDGGSTNGLY